MNQNNRLSRRRTQSVVVNAKAAYRGVVAPCTEEVHLGFIENSKDAYGSCPEDCCRRGQNHDNQQGYGSAQAHGSAALFQFERRSPLPTGFDNANGNRVQKEGAMTVPLSGLC